MIGSSASGYERMENDWYVEPSWSVDGLLAEEKFIGTIYDPACGRGTIPKACLAAGYPKVVGSDIAPNRGFGHGGINFFTVMTPCSNIISNPPYGVLKDWIDHALTLAQRKVAIIARLSFLESQDRKQWFETTPLKKVLVSSRRISMPPGAKPDIKASGGSVAYAWFIWDKEHTGNTILKWF